MRKQDSMIEMIQWQISVPIFRNTVILKQLGFAIGIPFGMLTVILVILSGKSVYTLYAIGLITALFIFTWLFIMVVYRGRYEVEFVLDNKGVLCRTQAKQEKKNSKINCLTVLLGFLSGKPTVAGAGMIAWSRQSEFLKWTKVRKVKYQPRCYTILLWYGLTQRTALFCTKDNYLSIVQTVKSCTSVNGKRNNAAFGR